MLHWFPGNEKLAAKVKEIFLQYSTRQVVHDDGVVYLQEDKADKFYIVISGYVRLSYIMEDGSSILYAIVPPGQSFGELGVFDRSVYPDTASAIGSACVLAVRADVFHADTPYQSELKAALSALLAERYRNYIDVTKVLYLNSLSARLAASLLRLTKTLGQNIAIGGRSYQFLGPMVTQSDLGAMARGTRGNVNRLLKRWAQDGLILIRDRKIILLDRRGLCMRAMRDEDML